GPSASSSSQNGTQPEAGLGPLGSLERVIAQVDMEESGDSGAGVSRPEHTRPPVDGGYPNSRGGSAGSGAGGGGGGGGSSAGGGWTDMFQGMTVEVRGEEEG
ncbi:unnamed protein product, partial [Ectocarpus sp. 12 AP-2014]